MKQRRDEEAPLAQTVDRTRSEQGRRPREFRFQVSRRRFRSLMRMKALLDTERMLYD
ncbi:MAG TPA: hypothetical protein VND97_04150 [Beijerinckiaceae bacterium]|nr:hypothetical protein [Beijerinckiaceae bacterium]